ncbi:hypothetical protein Stsp02_04830 [Streptomyces sp. NBRC 14336]|nr:hypothetical protein Stsp02_04830 [Streptomyces sp. NBRC 14336]
MNAAEGAQVYVPQATPPPAYEGYPDPAAAHGWQNAYDETRELSRVPDADGEPAPGPRAARRSRRRGERRRHALMAAGALGAASLAAVVAGFALSSGDSEEGKAPARTTRDDSGVPADPWVAPSSAPTSSPTTPAVPVSPTAAQPRATESARRGSPTPTAPASTAPAAEPSATRGPGNSGKRPPHAGGKGPH